MSYWKNKRVFVTGATGLVGSWLTRRLVSEGAYVVTLIRDQDPQSELYRSGTNQKVSVVTGALEDYSAIERAINEHEVDTVFHLGAQTIVGTAKRSPLATFESNIRGTYNLLEACRVHRDKVERIAIASSDKAYGTCLDLPYDESMPTKGEHPYDVSKSCTDMLARTYFVTYDLPIVTARCGNIYGGGDLNWSRIIPGTIRALNQNEAPILRSDGKFKRDYVYVEDAVEAYLTMASALDDKMIAGEAFNFGPSEPKTVLEVVDALRRVMGKTHLLPIITDSATAEIRDQYLDSRKAASVLGLRPTQDLEIGLRKTVAWYQAYLRPTSVVNHGQWTSELLPATAAAHVVEVAA